MTFRRKAFGLHLSASVTLLTLILGALYLGWYRWPGWYLTGALHVVVILGIVDLALGPSLTHTVASPRKPRRALARDIGVIVIVQLAALVYGAATLWLGRPLYYPFSLDRLQIVQGSDLEGRGIALATQQKPRYFRSWEQGLPKLRQQLARVDDLKGLSKAERDAVRTRMSQLGLAPGERNALLMWGDVRRVLVIFDPGTLRIRAILKP